MIYLPSIATVFDYFQPLLPFGMVWWSQFRRVFITAFPPPNKTQLCLCSSLGNPTLPLSRAYFLHSQNDVEQQTCTERHLESATAKYTHKHRHTQCTFERYKNK